MPVTVLTSFSCVRVLSSRFSIAMNVRTFGSSAVKNKGIVLGLYEPQEKDADFMLTPATQKFSDKINKKLEPLLKIAGRKLKCGKSRLLYGLDETYTVVALANLGKQDAGYNSTEQLDESSENIRSAVANAVLSLRDVGETEIEVEPCGNAEAAAEGCYLSLHSFDELRHKDKRKPVVNVTCHTTGESDSTKINSQWARGHALALGQNFSRRLKECPSNKMTPSIFCADVQQELSQFENCAVTVRDENWLKSMNMGAFLAVSQGSITPPKLLEIDYKGGADDKSPVAFVGKGVTFDSGGISIKPSADMDKMRADMGGAACVVGSILTAAKLQIPINIKGVIPLCENMPSDRAVKPGDVVVAMNGKSIQIDNTDAEGRLILADALCYVETFQPKLILDIATLTGAVMVALGAAATAVYTKSDNLWENMQRAGSVSGDRVWRMPLFKYYTKQMVDADLADINNLGKKTREAGSCTAAAFLQEFVTSSEWLHLDMAGVMLNRDDVPYLGKGMSGRPTRTLVHFLDSISKQQV